MLRGSVGIGIKDPATSHFHRLTEMGWEDLVQEPRTRSQSTSTPVFAPAAL